jgi:hypothetical protein
MFRWVSRSQYNELMEEKTFRQVQKEKPRYEYVGYIDSDWEYVENRVELHMTDTWGDLQKEYNEWKKNRYHKDVIYFVY